MKLTDYAPSGSIQGSSNNLRQDGYKPVQNTKCGEVPRPNVDTIDLLRLGESEGKTKKGEDAGSEGQEASHLDQE
jgi:hypothetical protein